MTPPDAHGWMPIETAPTTGVFYESDVGENECGPDLLLFSADECFVGSFEGGRWYIADGGYFYPTHWQPLPAPPVSEGG